MKFRVEYSGGARANFAAYIDYLRASGAPERYVVRWYENILATAEDLQERPYRGMVDDGASSEAGFEVRRLIVRPYVILYAVDEKSHVVMIIAIVHGAMD